MKSTVLRLISSKYFKTGLGIGISGLCLYLALRNVNLEEIWSVISQANIRFIGLALISVSVNILSKAFRWRVLLGPGGQDVSPVKILGMLLVGQMLNLVIPGRIGDLTRAYVIGGLGPGRVFTLGTIALEKVLDMLSYAILVLFLLLLIPFPTWIGQSAYTLVVVALIASIIVVILAYHQDKLFRVAGWAIQWLPEWLKAQIMPRFASGISSLTILQSQSGVIKLILWSTLIWFTAVFTNHLTLLALDIHLPLTASMLLLIVLQAGISIPSVPGRIGVYEYLTILSLTVFGIGQAVGLSYGILLHSIALLPPIVLGLLFFWIFGLSGMQRMDIRSVPERN